jgi:hypothetical protein
MTEAKRDDGAGISVSGVQRGVRPRAWELRKDGEPYRLDWHTECRSTAYSWHPLYDQAALDAATTQAAAEERDKQRNVREVFARWIAEACGVLFEVEEDAEDGGEHLRMLRERGLRLVRAVMHPKPGELPPWLKDDWPNAELTCRPGTPGLSGRTTG